MMLARISLKYNKYKKRKYRTGTIYHIGEFDYVIHTPFDSSCRYRFIATELTSGWKVPKVGGYTEQTCFEDLQSMVKSKSIAEIRVTISKANRLNEAKVKCNELTMAAKVVWIK
jgi:hypothetical protein